MKVRLLVPKKKIKYNKIKFNLDISKPITKDSDKDGIPNYLDCAPFDSSKSGILHDWIKKQRLLQEQKHMAKLDIEPLKEEQEYFDEELSKAETGIQHFKGQVGERTEQYRENTQAGLKDTDKKIQRMAQHYSKQAESKQSDPRMQKPEVTRGVHYLIPARIACRKMFHDAETGQPSSIPKFKRDVYKPYSPSFASGMFTPQRAPNPPWLIQKQRERELIRQYLKLKAIRESQQGEKQVGEM